MDQRFSEKDGVQIVTFGCRLNIYESEKIKMEMNRRGNDEKGLNDFIVVNTCAVTAEAERQARQAIRKLNRQYPNKKIVVTGCSATINPKMYENLPGVYAVFPNPQKEALAALLLPKQSNKSSIDSGELPVLSSSLLSGFEGKARAFLQIQTGCDHCCSFCLIHFARGPSRSFPVQQILNQAKMFADQGYQEINLTGVDLCSYLSDFKGESYTLGKLVKLLLSFLPNVCLRLSSLDPAAIDADLQEAFYDQRLLPHVHLSLQSGDDDILKRMLRRHTSKSASQIIRRLRRIRPDIVFGADIICGFPTETSDMFSNTIRFVQENQIALLHVFPYSDRPGTVALSLKPKVFKYLAKARVRLLRQVGYEILQNQMHNMICKKTTILIERKTVDDYGHFIFFGKTKHFLPSIIKSDQDFSLGQIVPVIISSVEQGEEFKKSPYLYGVVNTY